MLLATETILALHKAKAQDRTTKRPRVPKAPRRRHREEAAPAGADPAPAR